MRAEQEELLKQVAACGNLEGFEASGLDLNVVVRVMLDTPGQPRKSSKNVIKAFARAMRATRLARGVRVSRYSQAVEMLAYAAVCAPLLEPDQLVRVIDLAEQTSKAYAPQSLVQTGEGLAKVLAPYSSPRRERLVKDLWVHAHRDAWWAHEDVTPLPALSESNEDALRDLCAVQGNSDLYGLPDTQLTEWVKSRAQELLDRSKGLPAVGDGNLFDLAAYVACLQDGGMPESGLEADAVEYILDSPLAECLDASTLVRLVEDSPQKVDHLADRSELLGPDAHLIPEVVKLVEGSSSVKVLASSLVSPERFGAFFRDAQIEVKTNLLASSHLTSQQAHEYFAELNQALMSQRQGLGQVASDVLGEYCHRLPESFRTKVRQVQSELTGSSVPSATSLIEVLLDSPERSQLSMLINRATDVFDENFDHFMGEMHPQFAEGESFGDLLDGRMPFDHEYFEQKIRDFEAAQESIRPILREMDKEFWLRVPAARSEFDLEAVPLAVVNWDARPVREEVLVGLLGLSESYFGSFYYLHQDMLSWVTRRLFTIRGLTGAFQDYWREASDPHVKAAIALNPAVSPENRPDSPAAELIQRALVPVEAGERHLFPDAPIHWGQLSDKVDSISFPYPPEVLDLSGTDLPDHPGVTLQLVRSSAALKANSERMGNCTNGYAHSAREGRWVVFHFEEGDDEYNASIEIRHGSYQVGEVNTRFNRGNVSPKVKEAFTSLVAGLNA